MSSSDPASALDTLREAEPTPRSYNPPLSGLAATGRCGQISGVHLQEARAPVTQSPQVRSAQVTE